MSSRGQPPIIENECLKDDSVKFASLTRGRSPVDSLCVATKGDLDLSPRYREIPGADGLGGRVRAALVCGLQVLGFRVPAPRAI
jgi:hypothetical protein